MAYLEELAKMKDGIGGLEIGEKELDYKGRTRRAKEARKNGLVYGFDFGSPGHCKIVTAGMRKDYHIGLFGRLGIHCYNLQKGKNLKFVRLEKYGTIFIVDLDYYITCEATDPPCNSVLSFQTLFTLAGFDCVDNYVIRTWRISACRLKCNEHVDDRWEEDNIAIDQFYTRPMPKWLCDEALASDNKKYLVVQGSELQDDNDWLHLFMELAFFCQSNWHVVDTPSLEINKVVVETKEDYITEAREKLKADNAIFYISYKCNDPSNDFAGDHKAIVRKTMDGKPEHMTLEVAVLKSR